MDFELAGLHPDGLRSGNQIVDNFATKLAELFESAGMIISEFVVIESEQSQ